MAKPIHQQQQQAAQRALMAAAKVGKGPTHLAVRAAAAAVLVIMVVVVVLRAMREIHLARVVVVAQTILMAARLEQQTQVLQDQPHSKTTRTIFQALELGAQAGQTIRTAQTVVMALSF